MLQCASKSVRIPWKILLSAELGITFGYMYLAMTKHGLFPELSGNKTGKKKYPTMNFGASENKPADSILRSPALPAPGEGVPDAHII